MRNLNEREIIKLFITKLKTRSSPDLGKDDVAIVPLKRINRISSRVLAFKCDMLVESTDVPSSMQPWQIARKSIVSVISDLSAKGIRPYSFLISVGIPSEYTKNDIEDLIKGFEVASREFGIKIVGGDTNRARELVIDCCAIGLSDPDCINVPRRKGARPGDLIVTSGEFGFSSSGLKILLKNAQAEHKFKTRAICSLMNPIPQQKFGISLAKFFSSSIDSSDGLAVSLYELVRQSKTDFFIDEIPSVLDVFKFAKDNGLEAKDLIFHGGEEYEIVATIPISNFKKAEAVARKSKLKLHLIGRVREGSGKVFVKANDQQEYWLLEDRGYDHFV